MSWRGVSKHYVSASSKPVAGSIAHFSESRAALQCDNIVYVPLTLGRLFPMHSSGNVPGVQIVPVATSVRSGDSRQRKATETRGISRRSSPLLQTTDFQVPCSRLLACPQRPAARLVGEGQPAEQSSQSRTGPDVAQRVQACDFRARTPALLSNSCVPATGWPESAATSYPDTPRLCQGEDGVARPQVECTRCFLATYRVIGLLWALCVVSLIPRNCCLEKGGLNATSHFINLGTR